jgi:hypothetical protein
VFYFALSTFHFSPVAASQLVVFRNDSLAPTRAHSLTRRDSRAAAFRNPQSAIRISTFYFALLTSLPRGFTPAIRIPQSKSPKHRRYKDP